MFALTARAEPRAWASPSSAASLLDVFAHEHFVGGGRRDDAVLVGLHAAGNAEPAMHVNPLVLLAREPALDFLEIGEVVDLAEIRELLLRAHAQRIDLVDRSAQRVVLVDHR